jgi:hypothetical protein
MVTFGQHPERGEGIGVQGLPWRDGFLGKGLDIVLGHLADGFHGDLCPRDKPRPPVIVFARGQDGCLAFGTASALATDKSIIEFDNAFQPV